MRNLRNLTTARPTANSVGRPGVRPIVTGAALGLAALAATVVPATAQVLDEDRPRLTHARHDFGVNWTLGAPRNGGYLDWDLTAGRTTPELSGYHYLTDRECGRVRVEYYNDSHTLLGSRNGPKHCAPGNGKTQWWTEINSFDSTTVTHVHVLLQDETSNNSFTTVESRTEDFD